MKYRRSCSPIGLLIPRLTVAYLFLALISVEYVKAQPGYVPSVEELEKELQPRLNQLAGQIRADPQNGALYVMRATIYKGLYDRARYKGSNGAPYADNALADLSAAIGMEPTAEALKARAGWYLAILRDSKYPTDDVKASVDFRLRNKNFEAAKSDLLSSIRLDPSDENLTAAFNELSQMHLERAQGLAKVAEMRELAARGENYSVMADFDAAIEYAKKSAHHGRNQGHDWPRNYYREQVATGYAAKGRAATEQGNYDSALESFKAGEEYITDRNFQFCGYYSAWADAFAKNKMFDQAVKTLTTALTASNITEWNCRSLLQTRAGVYTAAGDLRNALADYTALWEKTDKCCREELSLKRAKLHIKLNEPELALALLEDVFVKPGGVICPQPYLLRAETYKLLGNMESAAADEESARTLGSPSYCIEY